MEEKRRIKTALQIHFVGWMHPWQLVMGSSKANSLAKLELELELAAGQGFSDD